MIRTILGPTNQTGAPDAQPLLWLDLTGPTSQELDELAVRFSLHKTSVADSLEPEHLPKHELIGDAHFVILRGYDPEAPETATTAQELTRKVALFILGKTLITISRKDLPYVARV